jgi:hypothetical protein
MKSNIKNYTIIAIPILTFILSPFWKHFVESNPTRMTFSYWVHWAIIYGGGLLIAWCFGYYFWGGVQLRINKKKKQYDKEINDLLEMNKSLGKELNLWKNRIKYTTENFHGYIDTLSELIIELRDKIHKFKGLPITDSDSVVDMIDKKTDEYLMIFQKRNNESDKAINTNSPS